MATRTNPAGSFRVPNSIIQGLTTDTPAGLHRLTAFQTVTLLGLLTRVGSDRPEVEVRMRPGELLDVIAVSKSVAQVVEREWELSDGRRRRRSYKARRHSPRHLEMVHEALLELFQKQIFIRQPHTERGKTVVVERTAHVLDSFGYEFVHDDRKVDPDSLPSGLEKENVGSNDRPVFRVRRADGEGRLPARAVLFRLGKELAEEVRGDRGTLQFTVVAGKVFGLFKEFMRRPAAIRLALLVLRQTGDEFTRCLRGMLASLGFDDDSHPDRAIQKFREVLDRLKDKGLVAGYDLNVERDRLHCGVNKLWHREDDDTGREQVGRLAE